MAVLIRCFRPPSLPNSGDVLRRPKELLGGTHTLEELVSFQRKGLKVARFSIRIDASSDNGQIFPRSNSRCYMRVSFKMPKIQNKHAVGKLSVNSAILEYISDHQRFTSFSFTKAFILANTMMLLLPLDVLAETCEADNSFFNMPFLFIIALIGATVGGLLARQRKGELKRLNDQLRQINAALRRQAKIESYAPELSYAPVGRIAETEIIVDPRKQQLIANLRSGKNYLRNQDPEKAFMEFKTALELAQALGDHVEEKKAARGLGASLQRQGKYKEAIKYHSHVLKVSKKTGEESGNTEAYGAIADCFTELGDLEQAGKFYDKYIARLEAD